MRYHSRVAAAAALGFVVVAPGLLAQRQGDNHTNPPIIIGKGSLLWYKASGEIPNACHQQANPDTWCNNQNNAYPICKTANGQGWCVKLLTGSYDVIDNNTGRCTLDRYALDSALINWGTEWAEERPAKTPAKGLEFMLTGTDPHDSQPITLRFVMGDERNKNSWELKKGRLRCILDDSGPAKDGLPREFTGLTEIRAGGESHPVAWASCKYPDCAHEPPPQWDEWD